MEKWKKDITQGNEYFENNQFEDAITAYKRSKERAEKLFHLWSDAEQVTAALIVSYHNLAELYLRSNRKYLAFSELQQVLVFLTKALDQIDFNSPRRLAVQNGANRADLALLDFVKQHQANTRNDILTLNRQPTNQSQSI